MAVARNRRNILVFLGVIFGFMVTGCATIEPEFRDPRDPFENYNRAMHRFNTEVDDAVLKPVARGYRAITPAFVDRGITNFFGNLEDVGSAINNLLQFKLSRALTDTGRVVVNSTLGVLGFLDLASNMNLPKYGEDFGQTLGSWGIDSGPYIVLPLLGPSSGRDVVGTVVDIYTDPLTYLDNEKARWALRVVDVVDTRADLLDASRVMEQAALDPYAFLRDAYLQKRRSDVYDGNPPLEEEEPY